MQRFSGDLKWSIQVTPADPSTGYRCVNVAGVDEYVFAEHLARSLMDIVFVVDHTKTRLHITKFAMEMHDGTVHVSTAVDRSLTLPVLLPNVVLRAALKGEGLPLWVCTLQRLRRVSYDTVAVLDQRNLLVEAPDVIFEAEGNMAE
jgi:hypothetical protein